eukprot:CAMPEP_0204569160 /NCGR_PEP_ID=MMETSP0661-20131031/37595_1 /ASSEMBLY_ACC=CAM_ASM_000606 /TAXON_ID=109239 /ORGANISM="Alexandrium margalefi, Strain AMGDE01CS-322" /LENGTH=43 /DNA_ID= /DNA_START= /DNA_END= /DNA_ORIENTATION=
MRSVAPARGAARGGALPAPGRFGALPGEAPSGLRLAGPSLSAR